MKKINVGLLSFIVMFSQVAYSMNDENENPNRSFKEGSYFDDQLNDGIIACLVEKSKQGGRFHETYDVKFKGTFTRIKINMFIELERNIVICNKIGEIFKDTNLNDLSKNLKYVESISTKLDLPSQSHASRDQVIVNEDHKIHSASQGDQDLSNEESNLDSSSRDQVIVNEDHKIHSALQIVGLSNQDVLQQKESDVSSQSQVSTDTVETETEENTRKSAELKNQASTKTQPTFFTTYKNPIIVVTVLAVVAGVLAWYYNQNQDDADGLDNLDNSDTIE